MNALALTLLIGLWVAVCMLSLVVFALTRQIGVLHERIKPAGALMINQVVKAGDKAPIVNAPALSGATVELRSSGERAMLLFFLSPTCPVCKTLLPTLASSSSSEGGWLDIFYVSDGNDNHAEFTEKYQLPKNRYVISEEAGRRFGVSKLPYAVLVRADGIISSMGLINSREHLESLFNAKEAGLASIQEYFAKRQTANADRALGMLNEKVR